MLNRVLLLCIHGIFLIGIVPALYSQHVTDVFISEYVEGSSNNKAIELYNGTDNAIDLANGNYVIQMNFNGNSTVGTTVALTGTIYPKSIYILAHASSSFIHTNGGVLIANQTSTAPFYNGDDAIVLRKGGGEGTILDIIGEIGVDPGDEWGTGLSSTANNTLRRKSPICQGKVISNIAFDPSLEWEGFAQDDFSGLGSHTSSCTTIPAPITVSHKLLDFTTTVGSTSYIRSYTLIGDSLSDDVKVTAPSEFGLSTSIDGPFSGNLIIDADSANVGITIYVQYYPLTTGDYTGHLTHISGSDTTSIILSAIGRSTLSIPIYEIQGFDLASSFDGTVVNTEGIVVGDLQGPDQLNGFFLQDTAGDGNLRSSDGIFVFNTTIDVKLGDYVRLTGEVDEFFTRTEIKNVTSLDILSVNNKLPTAIEILLPVDSISELERYEGMYVKFPQTLTATEVYTLGRYGEVSLSVAGRLYNPTNFIDPNDDPSSGTTSTGNSNVAAVTDQQNLNDRSRILLDDGSSVQNPAVVPFLNPIDTTLRVGSTVANVTGIMSYDFNRYRILPTVAPVFNYAPRPAVPTVGAANVKVACFNVLNYFNGDGMGGGFPTARGANTLTEFNRQRAKIIAAISQLNADVVGLMEIENDGSSSSSAIADLVNGLNEVTGSGMYAYIVDPTEANGGSGTDAIKVALIYKPGVVFPLGHSIADNNSVHNRPPLAQTFALNGNSEKFTVIVNHFKSKSCGSNTEPDQLDGQGCFNPTRKLQAQALLTFISHLQDSIKDQDIITVGDYNAYGEEDPIDLLVAGGLINLLPNSYSYVFNGQSGSLDHAFISSSLAGSITGAEIWHINAEEPIFKDYNTEFNPAYAYNSDPFRSSDHDPLLIGFNLQSADVLGNESWSSNFNNLEITVSPIPVTDFLNIRFNSKAGLAEISLLNSLSINVLNTTLYVKEGSNNIDLSVKGLKNGIYYLNIISDSKRIVHKVVISGN